MTIEEQLAQLKPLLDAIAVAAMSLPHAPRGQGRQSDIGANIQSRGCAIIPLYTDPGVPEAMFAPDMDLLLKQHLFAVHRHAAFDDGLLTRTHAQFNPGALAGLLAPLIGVGVPSPLAGQLLHLLSGQGSDPVRTNLSAQQLAGILPSWVVQK